MICEDCGQEKRHHAKGLCRVCYQHLWHEKHRGECLVRGQRWREDHPDYMRHYREEHRAELAANSRRWQKKNPEKEATNHRRWRQANLERHATIQALRRARKRGVAHTATPEQIESKRKAGEVMYPGEKLDLHHVVPLSRDGNHSWGNIVFIPLSLNRSIGNKLPQDVYNQVAMEAICDKPTP